MKRMILVLAGVMLMGVGRAWGASVNEMVLEVKALEVLYDLDATPGQMKALVEMAGGLELKKGVDESPKVNDAYLTAIKELKTALVKGVDDDEIEACQEKVGDLEDKMEDAPDPEVNVTDGARKQVGYALRIFTPVQLAGYMATREDDAPDLAGELIDGMDEVRTAGLTDQAYAKSRKRIADDVAQLLWGQDQRHRKDVHEKIATFLDKVRGLKDDEFKSQREALEKEAHGLGESADPITVLDHWVRRDFGELLANPQLSAAVTEKVAEKK